MAYKNVLKKQATDLVMEQVKKLQKGYLVYFNSSLWDQVYQEIETWLIPTGDVRKRFLEELQTSIWQDLDATGPVDGRRPAPDTETQALTANTVERIKDIVDGYTQEFYDSLREDVADDVEAYDLPTSELADKSLLALYNDLEEYLTDSGLLKSQMVELDTPPSPMTLELTTRWALIEKEKECIKASADVLLEGFIENLEMGMEEDVEYWNLPPDKMDRLVEQALFGYLWGQMEHRGKLGTFLKLLSKNEKEMVSEAIREKTSTLGDFLE